MFLSVILHFEVQILHFKNTYQILLKIYIEIQLTAHYRQNHSYNTSRSNKKI